MRRQSATVTKQNYAAKFMQLVFVLWCYGAVTKAQSIEPSGKNSSVTIIHPRPTAVVGGMNSSKTALLSQMIFIQNHTSVPHNDIRVKSTIRPSHHYETSGMMDSNWTGNFAADSSRSDISLIIIRIAGVLALIIIASCIVIATVAIYRKRKQQRRANRPNNCSLEMRNISARDDYPSRTVADVETSVHLDCSVPGPTIVSNNNPVCIDVENEATMISDAVLANASTRISSFGDSLEYLSFHTKNCKNLEEIHSNSPSVISTPTSGFDESFEDLSLDGNYRLV